MSNNERADFYAAMRTAASRSAGPRPFLAEGEQPAAMDAELWELLTTQIGVGGLLVPEWLGGSGGQAADAAAAAAELGASLAAVPFFSTVALATTALLPHRGTEIADELLRGIAEGEVTAALAIDAEPDTGTGAGGWRIDGDAVSATNDSQGGSGTWRLSGRADFVLDGMSADIVLVVAGVAGGLRLFAVDAGAAGLERSSMRSLDQLRTFATVSCLDTPARLVGADIDTTPHLGVSLDLALALLSAEQIGCARRCLDNAVDYAKRRTQFDRVIGGFQAIKHQFVEILLRVELARSASDVAVSAADRYLAEPAETTLHELALAASLAKAMCSDATMYAAEECLHIFGGIGFTWEHDSHLYYRRAKWSEVFLGSPDRHRDRLAARAGLR